MASNSYMSIYQTLKERINGGELQAHETLPSENLLCTEFGVSRNTVRRALELLIDDALIIRKPGIGSSVAARPKARPRMPLIGLGLKNSERLPFYSQVLQSGVQDACTRHGAQLCLCDKNLVAPEMMESLTGFISVSGDPEDNEWLQEFAHTGKPVMLINRTSRQPELSYLAVDYELEASEMVGHALDLGYKRVAVIGSSKGREGFALRTLGWQKAYRDRGRMPPEELSLPSGQAFDEAKIQDFLIREQPEAIFVTAGELMNFLLLAGMRLNSKFFDDVMVMCFDDFSELEAWRTIPIAFIQMPLREMAELAVSHIVEYPTNPQIVRRIMKSRFVFNAGCLKLNSRKKSIV